MQPFPLLPYLPDGLPFTHYCSFFSALAPSRKRRHNGWDSGAVASSSPPPQPPAGTHSRRPPPQRPRCASSWDLVQRNVWGPVPGDQHHCPDRTLPGGNTSHGVALGISEAAQREPSTPAAPQAPLTLWPKQREPWVLMEEGGPVLMVTLRCRSQ